MKLTRSAIGASWLVYFVAWFVQVIKDGTTLSEGGLPGWEAFHTALFLEGFEGGPGAKVIVVLSALTNFVMVGSPIVLCGRFEKLERIWGWLLLLSAAIDAQWFLWIMSGDRMDLRAGYYMWSGSFFALAGVLLVSGREGRRT